MPNAPVMIKLELSVEDVNLIMGALGQGQYQVVADLIQTIRAQALPQLPKPPLPQPVEQKKAEEVPQQPAANS
jgi:hypothetical protein